MFRPIKRRQEFSELYKCGHKVTLSNISLFFLKSGEENQLAVIISSKEGNAVKRNRTRRLAKEVIRLNQARIKKGWRMAIKIRAPLLDNYNEAKTKILMILKEARLIENNNFGIN